MDCTRCRGPMVRERMLDLRDDSGRFAFDAWRCLICGEVWDPVILANRTSPPEPAHAANPRNRPRLRAG
jgi:hypothetical protein